MVNVGSTLLTKRSSCVRLRQLQNGKKEAIEDALSLNASTLGQSGSRGRLEWRLVWPRRIGKGDKESKAAAFRLTRVPASPAILGKVETEVAIQVPHPRIFAPTRAPRT